MCAAQTYQFSADTKRILDIFCNSIYKNVETFLRELISNASDALDKIKFQGLSDPSKLSTGDVFEIEIYLDKSAGTLVMKDTGIGMTKLELIKNLGTIAQTGTRAFLEAYAQGGDLTMIGQFGVGFYSVFLVAESVKVVSKSNDDDCYAWESTGDGTFSVSTGELPAGMERGTVITLNLKEDKLEFAEEKRIKDAIKRHSGFIGYPIKLQVEKERSKEITDDEEEEKEEEGEAPKIQELDEEEIEKVDEAKGKKTKTVKEKYQEMEVVNKVKPIWTRNASDITESEYQEFYKSISNDWEEHLAVKDFATEGQLQYRCILFIPKRAPFDLFENKKKKAGLKLYVRKVFILDDCDELLPEYLSFVRGVVDSDDLPLNISRETLQSNSVTKLMKKNIIKKILELLTQMKEDSEMYEKFYSQFQKSIKLGVHEDSQNQETLVNLLKFHSNKSGNELTDLAGYVNRMKTDQKEIYYICGEDKKSVDMNSSLEELNRRGYEVLLLIDTIDEYAIQKIKDYSGHKLVDVTKEGFQLPVDEEEKKKLEELKEEFKPLCEKFKAHLGTAVEDVYISNRLKSSPCFIVTGQYGWSANMERIMQNQALRDTSTMGYMSSKKKIELNPFHPIVVALKEEHKQSEDSTALLKSFDMLHAYACLKSGFPIYNKEKLASSLTVIVGCALGIDYSENTVEEVAPVAATDVEEPSQLEEVD